MFWKYLLNVVCLPDESFTRYMSALFLLWLSEQTCYCCWFSWLKPKAWLCGGAWSPFLSVCVVQPYLCTDRHEDMWKLKCGVESCFAVVTVACERFKKLLKTSRHVTDCRVWACSNTFRMLFVPLTLEAELLWCSTFFVVISSGH